MPWVRGHYARRPRTTGRRYGRSPSIGLIVLVVVGVVVLLYLITR